MGLYGGSNFKILGGPGKEEAQRCTPSERESRRLAVARMTQP